MARSTSKTVAAMPAGLIKLLLTVGVVTAGLLAGCGGDQPANRVAEQAPEPVYVGAAVCADCHGAEAARWQGSHHDLAMQLAAPDTVLGDFENASFSLNGVTSALLSTEYGLAARTDGPDGEIAEFPVRYAFGVDPLQQYLAELPDGRIQTLPLSWDSRAADEGGQRWFHVYGNDPIDFKDVLHWTRPSQSWDSQCAECHSTGIVKQYDVETGLFDTRWEEINVACEACHGPGSRHVSWAEKAEAGDSPQGLTVDLGERRDVSWVLDPGTGNSVRSRPRSSSVEIDTCAPCHSRRSRTSSDPETGDNFLNHYQPALLDPPLYFADGQIRDEVYVYGSFLQSRMYQQGVTCSDCHDPHSLELRAEGAQVCLQCHDAERFQTASHHLHAPDTPGVDCISCHMPVMTYMQVDARHDHSFRIPRPHLSVDTDIPNTCSGCHAEEGAQWAAEQLAAVHGAPSPESAHWSERLAAANLATLDRRNLLLGLAADNDAPAIVRATATSALQLARDEPAVRLVADLAAAGDPLLRWGAARALQTAEPSVRARLLPALLDDPVRAVRMSAASVAASVSLEVLPTSSYPAYENALNDYVDAQLVNQDRAEAHVNLANTYRKLNREGESERAYRTAIKVNPYFVPAYINLADLYRILERESDGELLLRSALEDLPDQSSLHHALGLLLIRTGRIEEGGLELKIAADAPDATPRFALAHALALDGQGENAAALAYLQESLARFGDDPALIAALSTMYQRAGNQEAADALRERLLLR